MTSQSERDRIDRFVIGVFTAMTAGNPHDFNDDEDFARAIRAVDVALILMHATDVRVQADEQTDGMLAKMDEADVYETMAKQIEECSEGITPGPGGDFGADYCFKRHDRYFKAMLEWRRKKGYKDNDADKEEQ